MPATPLPKAPLLGFHDPEAEQEIREAMGEDAGGEAFGSVGNPVIDRAGQERRGPIGHRVRETEKGCHNPKREPGK